MADTTSLEPRTRPPKLSELPPHQRERRQRIVQAALAMLEEDDYERIQIRTVAERAGVALGTVYRYFASKEHLYAAVMLEWAGSYTVAVPETGGGTDAERLKLLLRKAVRAFEKRPQFFRLEVILESSADEDARDLFDEFSVRHVTFMLASLSSLDPDDAAHVAAMANHVLAGSLRSWALGRAAIERVYEECDTIVRLIFEGPAGVR